MARQLSAGNGSNFSEMPVSIPNKLRSLLSPVKKISETGTLKEVLDGMQAYIYKNRLFDSRNPKLIHCENDALKEVLGVDHFTLYEIRRLLFKLMLQESPDNYKEFKVKVGSTDESSKRKAESGGEESKRVCGESSSSAFYDSLGLHNIQMSDLSSDESNDDELASMLAGEIFAVNHTYDIEYEVDTDSSDSFKSLTDSDSDFNDVVKISTVGKFIKVESDIEFWADMSSDDFSDISDLEIPESDKWECLTCGSRNKPLMSYCLKCWAVRNDWSESRKERLERRSKGRSRRKRGEASHETKMQADSSFDAPSSQETVCSSAESQCGSQPSSLESTSSTASLCILCCEKPKNATVVHGNSGHQFSCYRCARKLLSLKKPCPICRKNIERVIHQILIS